MRSRAFTLIELLVVVAILAILASIAVPNFLEAQTRAKLARMKADLRTVSNAMEAYNVDNNAYPFCNPLMDHSYLTDIPALTTPVAYLTSLPRDPFMVGAGSGDREYYRYYPVAYWQIFYPDMLVLNWKWILMSNGPDQRPDVDRSNAEDAMAGYFYMVYDPTNGSLSRGDVWLTNLGFMGGVSY